MNESLHYVFTPWFASVRDTRQMLRAMPRLSASYTLLRAFIHSTRSRSACAAPAGCWRQTALTELRPRPLARRHLCAAAGDRQADVGAGVQVFESVLSGAPVPEGDDDGAFEEEEEDGGAWVIDTPRGPKTLVLQDGVLMEPGLAASLKHPVNVAVKSAEFVKSSVNVNDCPPPRHPEFAFIGRSNVGKSSLVNCLTGRKQLALVSNTPGKTQTINHFLVLSSGAGPWYLTDLPGYGFARAPGDLRDAWTDFTMEYFLKRKSLVSVLLLIDGTIPPQSVDLEVAAWLGEHDVPFTVVFTKVDKRRKVRPGMRTQHEDNVRAFQEALAPDWEQLPPCVVTSSVTAFGRQSLLNHIAALRKLHIAKHGPIKVHRPNPVEKLEILEEQKKAKAAQAPQRVRAPTPVDEELMSMPELPKEDWELDTDEDDVAPPPGMPMPRASGATTMQANDIVKAAASRVGASAPTAPAKGKGPKKGR